MVEHYLPSECNGRIVILTQGTFCLQLPIQPKKRHKLQKISPDHDGSRRMTWISKAHNRVLGELEIKSAKIKREIVSRVEDLSMQVQNVIDIYPSKDSSPDMPKFVIDLEADKKKRTAIASKVDSYREGLISRAATDGKISSSLIKSHIESMQDPFHRMYEVDQSPKSSVCSFPLLSLSERDQRRINYVKLLRLNEIADMERREGFPVPKGERPYERTYIFGLNDVENGRDGNKDDSTHSDDGIEEQRSIVVAQDKYSSFALMYPPEAIRTRHRRQIQLCPSQVASRAAASRFNDTFLTLTSDKESLQKELNNIMGRIGGISAELGIDSNAYLTEPVFDMDVTPQCFGVEDTPLQCSQ